MGLRGEVFLGQGIHRAFETHVKLGDLAFGQSDDAREGHPLERGGPVLLVAADAAQRLAKHHVESLGLNIGHEFLNAGMDQGSAGDGTVGITLRYRPALAGGVFPALAQLILDGSVALAIGRIAGIVGPVLRGLGPIVKDPASWPTGRNRPAYGRSISAIISGSVATALDKVTVLYHRPRKSRVSSSHRSIHPIQRSSPFHGSCGVWQEESFEHAQLRNVSTRQIEKVCPSEARPGLAQSQQSCVDRSSGPQTRARWAIVAGFVEAPVLSASFSRATRRAAW